VRLIPIFDTNIFGDLQRGSISLAAWRRVRQKAPGRGWPLSSVTALELLAGVDAAPAAGFLDVKQRISAAYSMCSGRILEDPRMMLCKEILSIPFPADQMAPASHVIKRQMDVVRRGNSLEQLLQGIPYKGRHIKMNSTAAITQVMAGPKKNWRAAVHRGTETRRTAKVAEIGKGQKRTAEARRRRGKPRSEQDLLAAKGKPLKSAPNSGMTCDAVGCPGRGTGRLRYLDRSTPGYLTPANEKRVCRGPRFRRSLTMTG
jgi:hypothetical protein